MKLRHMHSDPALHSWTHDSSHTGNSPFIGLQCWALEKGVRARQREQGGAAIMIPQAARGAGSNAGSAACWLTLGQGYRSAFLKGLGLTGDHELLLGGGEPADVMIFSSLLLLKTWI